MAFIGFSQFSFFTTTILYTITAISVLFVFIKNISFIKNLNMIKSNVALFKYIVFLNSGLLFFLLSLCMIAIGRHTDTYTYIPSRYALIGSCYWLFFFAICLVNPHAPPLKILEWHQTKKW